MINIYALVWDLEMAWFYQEKLKYLSIYNPHECLILSGDFKVSLKVKC